MDRTFTFDLMKLSYTADYFKHYTQTLTSIPDSIEIYVPDVASIVQIVEFLGSIQIEEDTVYSLLRYSYHPKQIFILADYFGVWTVFDDIIAIASHPNNIQIALVFLQCSLRFYGPYYPFTINLFEVLNINRTIYIKCTSEPNMSSKKLRKLFRDCERADVYEGHIWDKCYLCSRPIPFKRLEIMPCCGTPLHRFCLLRKRSYYHWCGHCGTKIVNNTPYTARETNRVTYQRLNIRQKLGIPDHVRFRALTNLPNEYTM